MSEVSPVQDGSSGGSVTTVVRAHIKPGKEPQYEEWLHGINEECSQFAGFQGATVFRPDDESHPHPEYVIVVRFATYSDLRRWEGSQQFAEWRNRLEPLLRDDLSVDSVSGMETWFTLPGHSVVVPPPKYKMAVVATIGASPFVLVLIPFLIGVLQGVVPPIVVALIIVFVMSIAMTWGTMPLLSWLGRRWLYPVK